MSFVYTLILGKKCKPEISIESREMCKVLVSFLKAVELLESTPP